MSEYIPLAAWLSSTPEERARLLAQCGPHRFPQGPNEDISQCGHCGMPTFSKRPAAETFGDHLPDCSLPIDHDSYCQPGGSGHQRAAVIRG